MRAVLKEGPQPGLAFHDDQPEPTAGPGAVLIEIGAASVCGTDREMLEWTPSAAAFGLRFPVVLGHECAGTIVAVGEGVRHLAIGDRVAVETHLPCGRCFPCRTGDGHNCAEMKILGMHVDGAFAERMAVPANVCVPLPDHLPLACGALLEPAGVAMHALQRTVVPVSGGVILVNGCGPVGLFLAQLAQLAGAAEVIGVEPNPFRRELAKKLGITVLSPSDDIVGTCRALAGHRGGADVAFEVSGAPGTLPVLFEAVRREACVVTIAHPSVPSEVDIAAYINKKGVTLRGVFGRRLWGTWEHVLSLVNSQRFDLGWLITHRFPLSRVEEAIELVTGAAGKVVIEPQRREGGA